MYQSTHAYHTCMYRERERDMNMDLDVDINMMHVQASFMAPEYFAAPCMAP